VPRYRTEIVITCDRYVCLQLPAHFPEGRARITVFHDDPSQPIPTEPPEAAAPPDEDTAWWEELDGDARPDV